MLTKDDFLSLFPVDEKPKEVMVKGKQVYLRVLSLADRTAFEGMVNNGKTRDVTNFHAKFLCFALANERGERLFTEADVANIGKSLVGDAGIALFDLAWEHNLMGANQKEELKKSTAPEVMTGLSSTSASPSESDTPTTLA